MNNMIKKRSGRRKIAAAALIVTTVILISILGMQLITPKEAQEDAGNSRVSPQMVEQETAGGIESGKEDGTENGAGAAESEETETDTSETGSPDKEGLAQKEKTNPEMTILMVGDILLHTRVEDSARRDDGSYKFDAVFANLAEKIQSADLSIVNQEVIIGGTELNITGYPNFNAPYEIGDALVAAGFDVVCHATNHALDRNAQGIRNTLNYWQNNHPEIGVVGIYDSAEARDRIYTYEANGITVAILNYTYGTNGIPLPEGMPYAVNLLDKEQIAEDLKKAEEMADFTIVVPHWGTEYRLSADQNQELWAQFFVENGVDLVLGAHPHVIEPIEWQEDETGENQMLVYFSVGNFVNWTSESKDGVADRMVGGMAEVTLEKDNEGKVFVQKYGVTPIVCHVETGQDAVTVYALGDYTDELAAENEIRLQDPSFSLEYCEELVQNVWGNLAGEIQVNENR